MIANAFIGGWLSLRDAPALAYTPALPLDDPRIAKLRELLEQATKLLDGANQLVADLTEQLERAVPDKDNQGVPAVDRRRKPRA